MTESSWLPKLDPGSDPIYARIVAALERDVRLGAVDGGARLPPQRSLAESSERQRRHGHQGLSRSRAARAWFTPTWVAERLSQTQEVSARRARRRAIGWLTCP
jgi:DNA-binding transcriptional MocR family regulator